MQSGFLVESRADLFLCLAGNRDEEKFCGYTERKSNRKKISQEGGTAF